MAQGYPYNDRSRLLYLMLLMQAQQQAAASQGQGQAQQPGGFERTLNTLDKVRGIYNTGSDLYTALSGSGAASTQYTPLTNLMWNSGAIGQGGMSALPATSSLGSGVAQSQAQNALWNSGADSALADAGTGSLGNIAGGLGGAYMAYKGVDTVLKANQVGGPRGRSAGTLGGGMAGLGTGLAINALGLALGPIGWAGLLAGSLIGGGLAGTRLGDKDMWKTEGKRLGKLLDKGINIPESLQGARWIGKGRKTKDLINPYLPQDFVGETPQYGWTNNKFATSRNEADLTGKDIWGYSAFFDKFGNDWLGKFNPQQREAIANKALGRKAVNEHHGTIDINWTPELQADVDGIVGNRTMVPKATPQTPPPTVGVTPAPTPVTNLKKGILNRIR